MAFWSWVLVLESSINILTLLLFLIMYDGGGGLQPTGDNYDLHDNRGSGRVEHGSCELYFLVVLWCEVPPV